MLYNSTNILQTLQESVTSNRFSVPAAGIAILYAYKQVLVTSQQRPSDQGASQNYPPTHHRIPTAEPFSGGIGPNYFNITCRNLYVIKSYMLINRIYPTMRSTIWYMQLLFKAQRYSEIDSSGQKNNEPCLFQMKVWSTKMQYFLNKQLLFTLIKFKNS